MASGPITAKAQMLLHAVQRIKEEAEKAKITLSSSQEYEINLPSLAPTKARLQANRMMLWSMPISKSSMTTKRKAEALGRITVDSV